LLAALEKINVLNINEKRRIKRANFENEDTRYLKIKTLNKKQQHLLVQ
jgi:hypothetical protein